MAAENKASSSGISFLGALQVLFIGLKLANVINWPWWQVLLPLIIEFLVIVAAIVIVAWYESRTSHW